VANSESSRTLNVSPVHSGSPLKFHKARRLQKQERDRYAGIV